MILVSTYLTGYEICYIFIHLLIYSSAKLTWTYQYCREHQVNGLESRCSHQQSSLSMDLLVGFIIATSINFIVISFQNGKISCHLDISRPLLSYSIPSQIFRSSWFLPSSAPSKCQLSYFGQDLEMVCRSSSWMKYVNLSKLGNIMA